MKRKYSKPAILVSTIELEDTISNASSSINLVDSNYNYESEWEELADDERSIKW